MSAWANNPCRLCLRVNSENPIPNNPFYLYSIFDASGVKVSPGDELPQQLCNGCYLFINQSNIFRDKCQRAQKIFFDIINKRKCNRNKKINVGLGEIPSNSTEVLHIDQYEFQVPKLYNTENFCDESNTNMVEILDSSVENDSINAENKDIFEGIADLNSDNINLCQDNENLAPGNDDLKLNSENYNSCNENTEDNEELQSDNGEYLNSACEDLSYEDLNLDNVSHSSDNANLSADNANLSTDNPNLGTDNANLSTDNPNLSTDNVNLTTDNVNLGTDNRNLSTDNANLSSNTENFSIDGKYTIIDDGINAKCKECGKTMLLVSVKRHLKRHYLVRKVMKTDSKFEEMLAECDTCGRTMKKKHLLPHFLTHDLPDGKLVCKHCNKVFDRAFALLRHCRAKHGYEKVDKCSYCDFMGCTQYEVKIHEKQHADGGLTCNVCGRIFQYKAFLLKHMAVHTHSGIQIPEGEIDNCIIDSFKCPHCSHTSLNKDTIRFHMKRKHGDKNTQSIIKIYKKSLKNTKTEMPKKNNKVNLNKGKKVLRKSDRVNRRDKIVNKKPLEAVNVKNNHQIKEVEVFKNRVIQLGDDGSVQIVEGQNDENLKTGQETLKSNHHTLKLSQEPLKSSGETLKLSHEPLKFSHKPLKSIHDTLKSSHETLKTSNETSKSSHEPLKLSHETLKSSHETLKTSNETLQTSNGTSKSSHEPLKSSLETLKSGHALVNHEDKDLNSDCQVFNLEDDNLNINNINLVQDNNEFIHLDKRLNSGEKLNQNDKDLGLDNNDFLDYEILESDIEDLNIGNEEFNSNETLNSGNKELNLSNKVLNLGNKDLNLENEDINLGNKELNLSNEVLNLGNIDLNLSKEHLNLGNEDINLGNEDINLVNEDLRPDSKLSNQDNKRKHTKTNNKSKINKTREKQTKFKTKKSSKNKKIKNKVKCDICQLEILPTSMAKHLQLHDLYGDDPKKRFKNYKRKQRQLAVCNICGRRMPKNQLVAHFLKHDLAAESGILNCKHCSKTFNRPFALLRHCRARHGYEKVDKCSYCDFMGTSEYEVKVHERQKHKGGEPVTCEICGWSTKYRYTWIQHMAENHDKGPKILCAECPESFYTRRKLWLHTKQHHNRSPLIRYFVCPHCPHTKQLKPTIADHMKKKHNDTNTQDIKTIFKIRTEDIDSNTNKRRKPKRRLKTNLSNLKTNPTSYDLETNSKVQKGIEIKDAQTLNSVDFLSAFHQHLESDNRGLVQKSSDNLRIRGLSSDNLRINNLSNTMNGEDLIEDSNFEVVNEILITGDLNNYEIDLNEDIDMVECEDCGKRIKMQSWDRHVAMHARKKPVACEHCDRTFKRDVQLFSHLKHRHGYERKHKCRYCPFMGVTAHQVKEHERIHTGETPYTCNICNKAFRYGNSLKDHLVTHDETLKSQTTIQCDVCKKTFGKKYYKYHKKIHEPDYQPKTRPLVKCEVCDKMVQGNNLREHLVRHAGAGKHIQCEPKKRPCVKCEVCSKMVQENNLREHLVRHAGAGKQIQSEHCDKTFHRRSNLLRHCKASHGYEKTDKCSYCDFMACTQWEVRVHERSHTTLRPYSCQFCEKSFKYLSDHQRHIAKVHAGRKKKLKCKECPETFPTPSLLSTHRYQQHAASIYNYQCGVCHSIYQKRDSARKHLAKAHRESDSSKIVKLKLSLGRVVKS